MRVSTRPESPGKNCQLELENWMINLKQNFGCWSLFWPKLENLNFRTLLPATITSLLYISFLYWFSVANSLITFFVSVLNRWAGDEWVGDGERIVNIFGVVLGRVLKSRRLKLCKLWAKSYVFSNENFGLKSKFWPKIEILTKTEILTKNQNFSPKIYILVKNWNFGQTFKFWEKF